MTPPTQERTSVRRARPVISVTFVAVVWVVLSIFLVLICVRGFGEVAFDAKGIMVVLLVGVLAIAWIFILIQMIRYFRGRTRNGNG
jgi:hypothetical protein